MSSLKNKQNNPPPNKTYFNDLFPCFSLRRNSSVFECGIFHESLSLCTHFHESMQKSTFCEKSNNSSALQLWSHLQLMLLQGLGKCLRSHTRQENQRLQRVLSTISTGSCQDKWTIQNHYWSPSSGVLSSLPFQRASSPDRQGLENLLSVL